MSFSTYRLQFPFLANKIYLNHAAVSPLSADVREKITWVLNERGFGELNFHEESIKLAEETRALVGRLIHAPVGNIAFTPNTSSGFNWLAQGLKWKAGDQIIIPDVEFPANVYPFLNLEKKGVEVVFVKNRNGLVYVEDIEAAITPRTRLISISFVEFLSGQRNDLLAIGALCKKHHLLFSVDAIQGLGAIPLNVDALHIDFLSCGGQKWLMAPRGIGFMYMAPDLMAQIDPVFSGWMGVKNAWDFFDYKLDLLPDAHRFEYGTGNLLGLAGLSASLDTLLHIGIAPIEQHLLILGQMLVEKLTAAGLQFMGPEDPYFWSGIFTFRHKQAEAIHSMLSENNVICSMRDGALRFAPHFYNNRDDIREVTELISKWIAAQ